MNAESDRYRIPVTHRASRRRPEIAQLRAALPGAADLEAHRGAGASCAPPTIVNALALYAATIVATHVAFLERRDAAPYLVEVDLKSGLELKRTPVVAGDVMLLAREADLIHVGAQGQKEFIWETYDTSFARVQRRSLRRMAADDGVEFYGFAVFEGRAIVVDAMKGVVAHVFDAKGRQVARHDCRGGLFHPGQALIERVGDLAVLLNVHGQNDDAVACGFRVDGDGAMVRTTLPDVYSLFVHNGVLYHIEDYPVTARRIDRSLHLVGTVIQDPRPPSGPGSIIPSQEEMCTGITGTVVWEQAWLGDKVVLRTMACCGDEEPAGIFVCEPPITKAR